MVGLTRQRSDAARLIPDTPIDVGGLSSFDATVSYRAARITTESVPLQNGIARFTIAKGRLDVTALSAEAEGGRVAATLTLDDAAHGPRTRSRRSSSNMSISSISCRRTACFRRQDGSRARRGSTRPAHRSPGCWPKDKARSRSRCRRAIWASSSTRLPGVELTDPMLAALHLRTPKPIRCAAGNFMLSEGRTDEPRAGDRSTRRREHSHRQRRQVDLRAGNHRLSPRRRCHPGFPPAACCRRSRSKGPCGARPSLRRPMRRRRAALASALGHRAGSGRGADRHRGEQRGAGFGLRRRRALEAPPSYTASRRSTRRANRLAPSGRTESLKS